MDRSRAHRASESRGGERIARTAGWAVLGAACILFALSVWSDGASAVIVHLSSGRRISYQPVRNPLAQRLSGRLAKPLAKGNPVTYHGGPVMTSNTNYTFYWSPGGAAAYPAGYQEGVDTYLERLAHDSGTGQNVDSVAAQYTNAAGEAAAYDSHFAGAIIDTDPYPANGCTASAICLTDEQIQAELTRYITANGLPSDLSHEYFVLTPPEVGSCFEASSLECSANTESAAYCAYHGYIPDGSGVIVYADDPYSPGVAGCDNGEHPSGSIAEGELQAGLSHEHNESITDPELDAWYGSEGEEIGDKCRTFVAATEFGTPLGTAPDGAPYNQVVDGGLYWYQQEWSNITSSCEQRLALPAPTVSKLAPKKGVAAGGTPVTIDGTGFTGATAVMFGPSPAKSFKVNSAKSITATAPAGSTGVADVRVVDEGGTSPVSAGDRFTYGSPTVTGVSPSSGPVAGGEPVSVSGSGFALGSGTVFDFSKSPAIGVDCTSSTLCTMTTPPAAKARTVDVSATSDGKKSKKSAADRYRYS